MKVEDLNPGSRNVNLNVQVIEKGAPREVVSRKDGTTHRVSDVLVGDSTGCIILSVWNEDIEAVQEGTCYSIQNGYITVFKDSMRLSLGRLGHMEKISEEIEPNTGNNVSDKKVERRPRFGGQDRKYGGRDRSYGRRRY
ncbi:MAG: single-stranded DNA-binding protein [Theionarchaea archaeon]|nr:single-stranded DNA-binding protein [Theionarchaea archaeon]MBU7001297.1 single-stranded DNA-binding protein [Theionarchaea archaeon]MBU7022176.1 single-stranded DNA-binding protein [Theionarchaea archaeon]MBU7035424.1 single-stranded DNA-binding protein [Theionarchaea archaeon]